MSQVSPQPPLADAIRVLSMDAVEAARSGHPGMPMGMAEIGVAVWTRHLKHDPAQPAWFDRDRFVLSNGHGSMLLYSLLHLTGYDLSTDDLKGFRRLHSRTPGHPELGYTPGVETTTGPLGQGVANAVGMAIAERVLAAEFNRDGLPIVDHHTYVFLGDGCLMEGISHEACSLAGTLRLGKLIALYDDNDVSIDGHVGGWFSDDTPRRFESYGWHVVRDVDGHDVEAVDRAVAEARREDGRPSLICCRTTIGKGSPNKSDSHESHGSPLGSREVAATREALGWAHEPFVVPPEVYRAFDARKAGAKSRAEWTALFDRYARHHPELAAEFVRRMEGGLPAGFAEHAGSALGEVVRGGETVATRKASQNAIEALAPSVPELLGGSADLASSNLTMWSGTKPVGPEGGGNYLLYGVREFGMAAIMNGLLAHGGLRPYGGTFLMFSEYARNAMRMAALMKLGAIYVLTHDSIALGQDGPTHQPVEQLATLRLMPNMDVWRPCDGTETLVAWTLALENRTGPTSLVLTRQNLAHQDRTPEQIENIRRGGYVMAGESGRLDAVVIATGSEVELALEARRTLADEGVHVRVVSMPSTRRFDAQDEAYRACVLPAGVPRVAVEAGVSDYWRKYVGLEGEVVGIDTFGESAPAEVLFDYFGLTTTAVADAVRRVLSSARI